MEANSDKGPPLTDGVLVVRALAQGEAGGLFRITMSTGPETDPEVVVVSSIRELHEAIGRWASGWTPGPE